MGRMLSALREIESRKNSAIDAARPQPVLFVAAQSTTQPSTNLFSLPAATSVPGIAPVFASSGFDATWEAFLSLSLLHEGDAALDSHGANIESVEAWETPATTNLIESSEHSLAETIEQSLAEIVILTDEAGETDGADEHLALRVFSTEEFAAEEAFADEDDLEEEDCIELDCRITAEQAGGVNADDVDLEDVDLEPPAILPHLQAVAAKPDESSESQLPLPHLAATVETAPAPQHDRVWQMPLDRDLLPAYRRLAGQIAGGGLAASTVILVASANLATAARFSIGHLAAALAERQQQDVLVVDAGPLSPLVVRQSGQQLPRGLSEVWRGEATWDEVVLPTTVPRVSLVPCGAPHTPPTASLDWDEPRSRFGYVLVDCGDVAQGRTAGLADHAEATLLVVALHATAAAQAATAAKQLANCGPKFLGCVAVS